MSRTVIRDPHRESRLVLRRAVVASAVVLLLFGVLGGRLWYLQVASYQQYIHLSQQNRVKLVPVPPTRGLIYDRNGILLAENRPSFRLVVTPEQIRDMDDTLQRLGRIIALDQADLDRFRDLLAVSRRFEEIPLKFKLTEQEVARLAVDRHRFPGVEVQAQLTRHYPLGGVAVHAIGYVGRINPQEQQRLKDRGQEHDYKGTSHIGKTGVEAFYEDVLHGSVGLERVETNALGRQIRVLEHTPPVPGRDVYLTLDIRLQRVAEEALQGRSGSIVAIAPNTGEILALVSKPGYDPNLFVNGISYDDYRSLQDDRDQPLFNRALRGQYPPGSTVKPFIGLAGLEAGTTGPADTVFCPGFFSLPGKEHRYRCWKKWGHGHVNLQDAIAESCDVYFYDLAYRLGIDGMSSFMKRFNFGAETGVDLYGELPGIQPSREWKRAAKGEGWYHGETVITGIGQGYTLATPLQLATATSILANRGKRLRPHLLYGTRSDDGLLDLYGVQPSAPPIELRRAEHWSDIVRAMRAVVHAKNGTARKVSAGMNYEMAGKTGTAQVFGIAQEEEYNAEEIAERLRDHALFIAFAPVDAPKLAVAVVVENGESGSGVAAPIARQVLDAYLQMYGHVEQQP